MLSVLTYVKIVYHIIFRLVNGKDLHMSPRWGFGGKGYHAAIDMSPRWGYKSSQNEFKREFGIKDMKF